MSIKVENLVVKRDKFELGPIDFELENGYVYALIGNNGAGKTTLINSILGTLDIESGEIYYDNFSFSKNQEEIKGEYAYVPDECFYTARVSRVAEAIATLDERFSKKKCYELLDLFEIDIDQKVKKLSKGNVKKLLFAIGLSFDCRVLVLDEPTANVDLKGKDIMMNLLRDYIQNENKIIIFSTHIVGEVSKIADYILLLDKGKLILKEDVVTLENKYKNIENNINSIEDIVLNLLK